MKRRRHVGIFSKEMFRGVWNILGWTEFIQQGNNCIYGQGEQSAIVAAWNGTGNFACIER